MPQDLYKWEDGGGLKHHCPICQMPLSHDKCRTVCLGNHVEWCHRYHTLFRKNWSSRCSACKTTDEQHEKRHREVSEILARIRKLKASEEAAALELLASPSTPRSPRAPLTAKALSSVSEPASSPYDTMKPTKKERKAAKKAAKALERERVVTVHDIQFVAKVLHPEGDKPSDVTGNEDFDGLSEDLEISMNLKFNNSICNTKSARQDFIVNDREQEEVDESEITRILGLFDIDSNAVGTEAELIKDLIAAVRRDLVCFQDELRLFKKNRAGFWRWANKRAYRDLVKNGKEWDAKNNWHHDEPSEGQCGREQALETDTEDELSRNGSIDSSSARSNGTALTIPSSEASSSDLKKATTAVKKQDPTDDDGWTQVGKKVLKPTVGKLTLSANGGLHHLKSKPTGRFDTLLTPRASAEKGTGTAE